jgi:hypothetical protein
MECSQLGLFKEQCQVAGSPFSEAANGCRYGCDQEGLL